MKPKTIFKLAVRLLGLWSVYQGLSGLPTLLSLLFSGAILGSLMSVFMIIWPLVVGWWLLGGAAQLVERAYPASGEADD